METNTGSAHVLMVEDDERLARLTARYLESHGLSVTVVHHGQEAVDLFRQQVLFDVVLLDLMLPGLGGVEVCRALRALSDVPVIMVTALGEEADRVLGLETGADDYLTKPFSSRELLARIRAQVRRARGEAGPVIKQPVRVGPLELDPAAMSGTVDGQPIELTAYEFMLLHVLAERAGRVLSREQLLELAKGSAEEAFDRSIDVRISRLRQKIEADPRHPTLLKTVRGAGYMLARPTQDEAAS